MNTTENSLGLWLTKVDNEFINTKVIVRNINSYRGKRD